MACAKRIAKRIAKRTAKRIAKRATKSLEGLLASESKHGEVESAKGRERQDGTELTYNLSGISRQR
jgi:hypothetical protein